MKQILIAAFAASALAAAAWPVLADPTTNGSTDAQPEMCTTYGEAGANTPIPCAELSKGGILGQSSATKPETTSSTSARSKAATMKPAEEMCPHRSASGGVTQVPCKDLKTLDAPNYGDGY